MVSSKSRESRQSRRIFLNSPEKSVGRTCGDDKNASGRTMVPIVWLPVSEGEGANLDGDDFQFRIDFSLEHAFDGHECAGQRTRTTAAGPLVTDCQCVVFEVDDFQITAVTRQVRPHFLVENFIDLQKTWVIAGDGSDCASNRGGRAIVGSRSCGFRSPNGYGERGQEFIPIGRIFLLNG